MSWDLPALYLSATASASITAGQVVKVTGDNQVGPCSGVTDVPIGVAKHDAASGTLVDIVIGGIAKVNAGAAAITAGQAVGTTAAGLAQVAATTQYPIGIALEGNGSAAVKIPVFLAPTLTPRA